MKSKSQIQQAITAIEDRIAWVQNAMSRSAEESGFLLNHELDEHSAEIDNLTHVVEALKSVLGVDEICPGPVGDSLRPYLGVSCGERE